MRFLHLLLTFAACLWSSQASELIIQPASGYFVCPQPGLACRIVGCQDGTCSIINNGYTESIVDGATIYTATDADANLSVNSGGDGSQVICPESCQCQAIVENVGCNRMYSEEPPVPAKEVSSQAAPEEDIDPELVRYNVWDGITALEERENTQVG